MVTEAEYAKGVAATTAAVASARIAGIAVSPEVIAVMERQNRGEIDQDEAIALVHAIHRGWEDAMNHASKPLPIISSEEQARRQEAVRYARASVRLEGFILGDEAEALNQRYISGELTGEQHGAAIRRLAGL